MSEGLQLTGAIAAALLAAAGLLLGDARARRLALGAALLAAASVVAGQAWDGQLADLRSEPVRLAGVGVAGLAAVGLLTIAFRSWGWGFPLAAVAVLAVRIPVDFGGESVNLLVPLYGVIAAGMLAGPDPRVRNAAGPLRVPRPLALALAIAVAAYAVQAIYSNDVEFAARNVAFFLVPFAALFALLAERGWGPRLLAAALAVVAVEAAVFALVAIGQQAVGELFWNDSLQASNDFHFYFRSNSIFWDPNIFGRYLAVALVLLCTALLFERRRREAIWLAGAVAIAWLGLLCSFSQTSFIALLAGLLVLCALRFSLRWAALAAPVLLLAVLGAIFIGGTDDDNRGKLADRSSGHSTLIEGGLELAADRPVYGYGSSSFPIAFREHEDIRPGGTTVSHNEPVTVAAEQGLVGLIIYVALLLLALKTLFSGMRAIAPGLVRGGSHSQADGGPGGSSPAVQAARIAIAAGFCALLVHTIGYASYLGDPLTWALLAIGSALAHRPAAPEPASGVRSAAGGGAPLRSGA